MTIAKLSDCKIKNSLRRWFKSASFYNFKDGISWYEKAQTFVRGVSAQYDIEPYKVAGVVSALSPNNKWTRNEIDTVTVIQAYLNGKSEDDVSVCTYNANKKRAFEILRGNTLITERSPKTHAFAMNVGLLSSDHITIDKWHLRACQCRPSDKADSTLYETVSAVQYRRIERITAELAKEFNLKGYKFQAIVWCVIKENWGR